MIQEQMKLISAREIVKAGLPILRQSSKKVCVANGEIVKSKQITTLPFPQLSARVRKADTFDQCPNSLMSVGQTSDDGTILIFTKDGVTVHKEEDVLITCKWRHCHHFAAQNHHHHSSDCRHAPHITLHCSHCQTSSSMTMTGQDKWFSPQGPMTI